MINLLSLDSIKCYITADISWSRHLKNITSKVGLFFWQFYKHANTITICKLCLAIVWPHLPRPSTAWGSEQQEELYGTK